MRTQELKVSREFLKNVQEANNSRIVRQDPNRSAALTTELQLQFLRYVEVQKVSFPV